MRKTLLIFGFILLVFSIPPFIPLVMEKLYDQEMNKKYKITEINEMFKGAPTDYQFADRYIYVNHLSKNYELYHDPWGYLIDISDIYIYIDGVNQETLEEYPVKAGAEGLNQYNHYLSYWLVEEKQTDKKSFVIVMQKNGIEKKEPAKGDNEGFVPQEKLAYSTLTIQEDGTLNRGNFTYENKNKLQTKLIPPLLFGGAGYYTNAWIAYPSILYPFIFPFLTAIFGLIFLLAGFPYTFFIKKKP